MASSPDRPIFERFIDGFRSTSSRRLVLGGGLGLIVMAVSSRLASLVSQPNYSNFMEDPSVPFIEISKLAYTPFEYLGRTVKTKAFFVFESSSSEPESDMDESRGLLNRRSFLLGSEDTYKVFINRTDLKHPLPIKLTRLNPPKSIGFLTPTPISYRGEPYTIGNDVFLKVFVYTTDSPRLKLLEYIGD